MPRVRRTRRQPLLLVATYREVELDQTRPFQEVLLSLNRERLATRLRLSRLDREGTRDMLAVLERKQRIHRIQSLAACGSSCRKCDSAATELYAWGRSPDEAAQQAACRET